MSGTITLLGREHAVTLPPQFAVVEELVVAYGEAGDNNSRRLRVCGAILGICTPLGREMKADYVKARFDVLAYGGAVYGACREKGATAAQVIEQAHLILAELVAKAFPREAEVAERAGFSVPAEAE
jgi:hypothetical protein